MCWLSRYVLVLVTAKMGPSTISHYTVCAHETQQTSHVLQRWSNCFIANAPLSIDNHNQPIHFQLISGSYCVYLLSSSQTNNLTTPSKWQLRYGSAAVNWQHSHHTQAQVVGLAANALLGSLSLTALVCSTICWWRVLVSPTYSSPHLHRIENSKPFLILVAQS